MQIYQKYSYSGTMYLHVTHTFTHPKKWNKNIYTREILHFTAVRKTNSHRIRIEGIIVNQNASTSRWTMARWYLDKEHHDRIGEDNFFPHFQTFRFCFRRATECDDLADRLEAERAIFVLLKLSYGHDWPSLKTHANLWMFTSNAYNGL